MPVRSVYSSSTITSTSYQYDSETVTMIFFVCEFIVHLQRQNADKAETRKAFNQTFSKQMCHLSIHCCQLCRPMVDQCPGANMLSVAIAEARETAADQNTPPPRNVMTTPGASNWLKYRQRGANAGKRVVGKDEAIRETLICTFKSQATGQNPMCLS